MKVENYFFRMMISRTVQIEWRHSSTAQPVMSDFTNRQVARTNQNPRLIPAVRGSSSRSLPRIESFYWPLLQWLRIKQKAMDFHCDMSVNFTLYFNFLKCITFLILLFFYLMVAKDVFVFMHFQGPPRWRNWSTICKLCIYSRDIF